MVWGWFRYSHQGTFIFRLGNLLLCFSKRHCITKTALISILNNTPMRLIEKHWHEIVWHKFAHSLKLNKKMRLADNLSSKP